MTWAPCRGGAPSTAACSIRRPAVPTAPVSPSLPSLELPEEPASLLPPCPEPPEPELEPSSEGAAAGVLGLWSESGLGLGPGLGLALSEPGAPASLADTADSSKCCASSCCTAAMDAVTGVAGAA